MEGESEDMGAFGKKKATQIALCSCLFVLLSLSPAFAKKATLKDILITNSETHLLLNFNLSGCFTDDMKKAVENGISITFTFFVRLYEVRDFWKDKKIAATKIKHRVHYDSLKDVYMVRLFEKGDEMIVVRNFDEVKKLMSGISGLKVAALHNLQKDRNYQVRMMAELNKIRLPLNLHRVFFFLSLWDFETSWHTVDFTY